MAYQMVPCLGERESIESAPGDGLQLGFKGEGWEGVQAILNSPAHGWVAQNTANLRRLHILQHNSTHASAQPVEVLLNPLPMPLATRSTSHRCS